MFGFGKLLKATTSTLGQVAPETLIAAGVTVVSSLEVANKSIEWVNIQLDDQLQIAKAVSEATIGTRVETAKSEAELEALEAQHELKLAKAKFDTKLKEVKAGE